jgi:Secretion system C-terminal sorting domain
MAHFFKTLMPELPISSNPKLLTTVLLLAGICIAQTTLCQTGNNACDEKDYPFVSSEIGLNLCAEYGNIPCQIEVGFGTPITQSSQLGSSFTGLICIKGHFWIDNDFSFNHSIVQITPGVTILVLPPPVGMPDRIFTIDDSKLYACGNLWNGITLSNHTVIHTQNGTRIEDARAAIKADNIQHCSLIIENTTFNKNDIGIHLLQSPSLPKTATIAKFSGNKFFCAVPLNGTADQISLAGIKTENVPFTINPPLIANHNIFAGLQYGILAEGTNTTVSGRYFEFYNIRRDGIFMNEGTLILKQSTFQNCEENGVNINLAHLVDIRQNCNFTVDTYLPEIAFPDYRAGVSIKGFALNSNVSLGLAFTANLSGTTTPVYAIDLKGGNVHAGTKVTISYSRFSIRAMPSYGIFLDGAFPTSSEINIHDNNFATGNPENTGSSAGISTSGNMNNLSIYKNFFTGNGYFNFAIQAENSSGTNNYVADNYIEGTGYIVTSGQYFSKGFFFSNFLNTTFCSNTNFFGSNYAFEFGGTNTGTVFTENKVYATGAALNILTNATIDPQQHQGNEWHPVVTQNPSGGTTTWIAGVHAICQTPDLAALSKFTVHTNQSVWDPTPPNPHYIFFSPFYPENIDPADPMFDFFGIDPSGTPASGCQTKFTGSSVGGGLDKVISDGLLPVIVGNPSMAWITKGYLYKKLKNNPSLISTNPSYTTFLSNNANSNIGKFYEVDKKIGEAFSTTETISQQSKQVLNAIALLIENLAVTDSLLESTTNASILAALAQTKSGYLEQLISLRTSDNAINGTYKSQQLTKIQEALSLNQQISPTSQIETNQKSVNEIYLQTVAAPSSNLTEGQIAKLKSIGQQCTETGGLAVSTALSLLPDCEKVGLTICPFTPVDNAAPLSFSTGGHEMKRPVVRSDEAWLYPNPAGLSFFLKLTEGNTGIVNIADLNGKTVQTMSLNDPGVPTEINHHLSPGVYLVKILTDSGAVFSEKLVVLPR